MKKNYLILAVLVTCFILHTIPVCFAEVTVEILKRVNDKDLTGDEKNITTLAGKNVRIDWSFTEAVESFKLLHNGKKSLLDVTDIGFAKSVLISNVKLSDDGLYTGIGMSSAGENISASIALIIKEPTKPKITSEFENRILQYGQKATFYCNTTKLAEKYEWTYINGRGIKDTSDLTAIDEKLTILHMRREFIGSYLCTAENGLKRAVSDPFKIAFKGLNPGPVTDVSFTANKTSVTLSWKQPTDLGHNLLNEIMYDLKYCSSDKCFNLNETNNTDVELFDLHSDTEYNFTIITKTTTGLMGHTHFNSTFNTTLCYSYEYQCPSEQKCLSRDKLCDNEFNCLDKSDEIKTCSVPKRIQEIEIDSISYNTIKVSWQPLNKSDRIHNYTIEVRQFGQNITSQNKSTNETMETLLNLKPLTQYHFIIYGSNPSGKGLESTKIGQTSAGPIGIIENVNNTSVEFNEAVRRLVIWQHPNITGGESPSKLMYSIVYYQQAMDEKDKKTVSLTKGTTNYTIIFNASNAGETWMYKLTVSNGIFNSSVNGSFKLAYKNTCPPNFFQCNTSTPWCIPDSKKCNRETDCEDWSDETNKHAQCEIPDDLQTRVVSKRYNFLEIKWNFTTTNNPLRFETAFNCTKLPNKTKNIVNASSCMNESCHLSFVVHKEEDNCTFYITPVYIAGTGAMKHLEVSIPEIGVVSTPQNIQASKITNKRSFNISWSAPDVIGNQLPTELAYKLVYCHDLKCDNQSTKPGMMYSVLHNLTMRKTYNVTVAAISANGFEGAAALWSFETLAPPSAFEVSFVATKHSINFTWEERPTKEAVEKIVAVLYPGNKSTELERNATMLMEGNLMMGTMYNLTIYAVNADGIGEKTQLTVTTKNCDSNEFECTNKQCITLAQKCNDIIDCSDSTDEIGDLCPLPNDVEFTIVPLYKAFQLKVINIPEGKSVNITFIVNINNNKVGENYTLPTNPSTFVVGIQETVRFDADHITEMGDGAFSPGVPSTIYLYAKNLAGNGNVTMKNFTTLGPMVGEPLTLTSRTIETLNVSGVAILGVKNASVVSYTIQIQGAKNMSTTVETNNTSFTHVISGLEPGTTYEVRYKVNDTDGASDYSQWKSFTTLELGIPNSPSDLKSRPRRNELLLKWKPGTGDRLEKQILRYLMMHSKENISEVVELDINTTSYIVSDLGANTTYIFNLTLQNAAGESDPATLTDATDDSVCPGYDWDYFDGNCYYYDDNKNAGANQGYANEMCKAMTSSLASILSEDDNENLKYEIMRMNSSIHTAYIGLNRTSNDTYSWLDDSNYNFNRTMKTVYDPSKKCVIFDINNIYWINVICDSKHGYACKRKPATTNLLTIKLNKFSFNMVNVTLPKTSFRGNRKMIVYVNDMPLNNMEYFDGREVVIDDLQELENISIKAREDFNGLGPLSNTLHVMTRQFVSPSKPENLTDEVPKYAESRSRMISWENGQLGDSKMKDLVWRIKYCSMEQSCIVGEYDNLTVAILSGLKANTTYNYTVYLFDTKYNKTSEMSDVMNFTTEERDKCRKGFWFCVGGTRCIANNSRCDSVQDCGFMEGQIYSVDESLDAGCNKPSMINVTEKIGGWNFIRITWQLLPISDRVVAYTILVNGQQYNVFSNITSLRIDKEIKNSTVYDVSIHASNPTGDGPAINVTLTTANSSLPSGPVSMIKTEGILGNENKEVTVSWARPEELNNNDPKMLKYKLSWCCHNCSMHNCSMVTLEDMTTIIGDLMPGTLYILQITTINEYNQSSSSMNTTFITDVCTSYQFECTTTKECINLTKKCDGIAQCGDETDELKDASCPQPPEIKLWADVTGLTFVHVKYLAGDRIPTLRFTFKLSNSSMVVLRELNVTNTTFSLADFTWNDLVPGEIYWITAVAHSYIGEGKVSSVNFTTYSKPLSPGVPMTASTMTVSPMHSSSVTIKWSAPSNTGGLLQEELNYRVKYCWVKEGRCKNETTNMTTVQLKGLQRNATYNISITALSSTTTEGDPLYISYTTQPKDMCMNMTDYFQCPIRCIEKKYLCNGVKDCFDGSDETMASNCSVPGMISVQSHTALWDTITFNWTAPMPESYVTAYYLSFKCLNNENATEKMKLPANATMRTFAHLTLNNQTANCSLSIFAENYAGNGTSQTAYNQTVSLMTTSDVTNPIHDPVLGLETKSVKLIWKPPVNLGNGRAEELTYRLKWCKDVSICNMKIFTTTTVILEDLDKATKYDIIITPINALGYTGKPLSFSLTTDDHSSVPSKPLMVKATNHRANPEKKIVVSWQPSNYTAGAEVNKLKYRIRYCHKDTTNCNTVNTKEGATKITLTGLSEDKEYVITVQAFGLSGELGVVSDPITYKTEDSSLPSYAIALIIIGVLIVVIIIIVILSVAHFKSKYSEKYVPNSPKEMSHMNKSYEEDNV